MGEPQRPAGADDARLAAYRAKIEEFEAMGLDTARLRKVLEEDPERFEAEAEALLRRELTGEETPEPETEPETEPEPEPETEPEPEPETEPEPEPEPEPEAAPAETEAEPAASPKEAEEGEQEAAPEPSTPAETEHPAGAEPSPPPALSAAGAQAQADEAEPAPEAEGDAPAPAPEEPSGTVAPAPPEEAPVDAIEEAMMEEMDEAIAEEAGAAPPPPPKGTAPTKAPAKAAPPPPPLAGGDTLGLAAASRPPAPSTAPSADESSAPAKKPPPPGADKKPAPPGAVRKPAPPGADIGETVTTEPVRTATPQPVRPVKVVATAQRPAPPGAKPAAAAQGPGATEVLPTERKRGRGAVAAAAILVIVVSAGLYLLLANAAPVAMITADSGPFVAGQTIHFNANASSDPNGDPMSFSWDFGDGAGANGSSVSHAYKRSGTYTVRLTATDNEGLAASTEINVQVAAGSITPPAYRYADTLDSTVSGTSKVEATGSNPTPLGTFTASLPPLDTGVRTYYVWGVNLTYTGTQTREVGPRLVSVPDGYLVPQDTYENKRFLQLDLRGKVDTSLTELTYTGESNVIQADYLTLLANDTVHRVSTQDTQVEIQNTEPPTTLQSSARLIEYPDLATASDQLLLEDIYAGRTFSTEVEDSGTFVADGFNWGWSTEGTTVISGQLAVALNFTLLDRVPGTSFITLYQKVWVSSASSFPLKEAYYVRAIEPGRTYESYFESVAVGAGTRGTNEIPYGDGAGAYPPPAASEFAPLVRVPTGGAAPDFSFSASDAYTEAQGQPDFAAFLASNPGAYAVNGSYGLNGGNPRWLLDFDQNGSSETMRIDVEHGGSSVVRTGSGQDEADLSAGDIGSVVSIDYATNLLEDESQAAVLFPGGILASLHANFTIRSALSLPSLSFNAASAATRPDLAYAFGVESRPEEPTRTRAFIDATTGQVAFSLSETGDSLP